MNGSIKNVAGPFDVPYSIDVNIEEKCKHCLTVSDVVGLKLVFMRTTG